MDMKISRGELLCDRLELPSDALGELKLTVGGRSRLLVENHRGIISYTEELIELDCGGVKLTVRGDKLRLGAMSGRDMLINGRIIALEFE